MYLTLCTPSNASDEFILTENAFSIHEGPVSYTTDRRTGARTTKAYTEFHVLGIISPTLAMLLRSNLLPEPIADRDAHVPRQKTALLAAYMRDHTDPANARSVLEDLPVAKARISYTKDVNGRLVPVVDDGNVIFRASDRFRFPFFRLASEHVQMLNAVMLDQASHISLTVYSSQAALRSAIEFYLDMPTRVNGIYSMKTVTEAGFASLNPCNPDMYGGFGGGDGEDGIEC